MPAPRAHMREHSLAHPRALKAVAPATRQTLTKSSVWHQRSRWLGRLAKPPHPWHCSASTQQLPPCPVKRPHHSAGACALLLHGTCTCGRVQVEAENPVLAAKLQQYALGGEIMLALANGVMICQNTTICWCAGGRARAACRGNARYGEASQHFLPCATQRLLHCNNRWQGGNILESFLAVMQRAGVRNHIIAVLDDETERYLAAKPGAQWFRVTQALPKAQDHSHPANKVGGREGQGQGEALACSWWLPRMPPAGQRPLTLTRPNLAAGFVDEVPFAPDLHLPRLQHAHHRHGLGVRPEPLPAPAQVRQLPGGPRRLCAARWSPRVWRRALVRATQGRGH